jgi:hypothetical protein
MPHPAEPHHVLEVYHIYHFTPATVHTLTMTLHHVRIFVAIASSRLCLCSIKIIRHSLE